MNIEAKANVIAGIVLLVFLFAVGYGFTNANEIHEETLTEQLQDSIEQQPADYLCMRLGSVESGWKQKHILTELERRGIDPIDNDRCYKFMKTAG